MTSGEVAEEWLADQDARVAAGDLARSSLDVTIGWYKAGETVFDTGTVESRTLTCESATGTVLAEHKVIIDRGERKLIGGVCTRKTK